MEAAEIRKAMGRFYTAHPKVDVEVCGCPVVMRTRLAVGDAERILPVLGSFADGAATMGDVCLKLFEVLAEGSDGKPVVDHDDRDWLVKCGDSAEIIKGVEASGVVSKVLEGFAPVDGGSETEGKSKASPSR